MRIKVIMRVTVICILLLSSAPELVHEWGHLRWGLGDEFPSEEDDVFWMLANLEMCNGHEINCARTSDQKLVMPNRCAHELRFKDPQCSSDDIIYGRQEQCKFEPLEFEKQGGIETHGSLMFDLNNFDVVRGLVSHSCRPAYKT